MLANTTDIPAHMLHDRLNKYLSECVQGHWKQSGLAASSVMKPKMGDVNQFLNTYSHNDRATYAKGKICG
jgi:hypothetical protein